MNIKKTILVLCLGALGACSSNPIAIKSDATVLDTEARRMKAIEYGERQWFHQALVEWKILSTIDPDNPEFANRINITESIIKRRVRSLLVHAKKTYKSGDVKHAQEQFLAILALEPSQHEALNYLRNIEETRVKAIQMAKTQRLKEKLNDSAKYDSMEEEMEQQAATEQAKIQVDNRYLELGITAFQNGDWENTIREVNKFISSRGATPRSRQLISQAHLNLSKAAMDQNNWKTP
ncbi:MAG: hypothetical protein OEY38_21270, partial [Gammaproteobacteria bacterium]|nr:hypothetical protein [Gammaproteobacteria bacterium]